MFCAATRTRLWKLSSTAVLSEVNDGQTTISGPPDSGTRGRSSARKRSVSSVVLCIFQLAARIAARSGILQSLDPGKFAPLHQLQRGAAAHRVAGGGGDRLGDGSGSSRERLELECPHRAIPEDRAGACKPLAEIRNGVAADVESHPA